MKRRKKLWIACAALAVVVALCALALLYRPVPYRFLEGSRYVKTELASVDGSFKAVRSYRVRGTVDSVAAIAQTELTPQDGWKLFRFPDGSAQFSNGDKGVDITTGEIHVAPQLRSLPAEPGTVFVTIDGDATQFDHFINWLEGR